MRAHEFKVVEGERGRSIGAAIGGVLGSRGAEIGGNIGDRVGDFFGGPDPKKPKTNTPDRPNTARTGADSANPGTAADGNPIVSGGAGLSSGQYDPDTLQKTRDNKHYRPARNAADGSPQPDADGLVRNSYNRQVVSPQLLSIEPDTQWAATDWGKLFVNYDNSPIVYKDEGTWPKDPRHPYYHMVKTDDNRRYDPYRTMMGLVINRDSFGHSKVDYRSSSQIPVQWSAPEGYDASNRAQQVWSTLPPAQERQAKLMAGYSNGSGTIMISWAPLQYMSPDELNTILQSQERDVSDNMIRQLAPAYGRVQQLRTLEFRSPVGSWVGQTFRAGNQRIAYAINVVGSRSPKGPHADQIMVWYKGTEQDYARSGSSAMRGLIQQITYQQGLKPLTAQQVQSEAVHRIASLAGL